MVRCTCTVLNAAIYVRHQKELEDIKYRKSSIKPPGEEGGLIQFQALREGSLIERGRGGYLKSSIDVTAFFAI